MGEDVVGVGVGGSSWIGSATSPQGGTIFETRWDT